MTLDPSKSLASTMSASQAIGKAIGVCSRNIEYLKCAIYCLVLVCEN